MYAVARPPKAPIPRRSSFRGEAVVRVEPSRGWTSLRLGELWEYRELLYFLIWRDVSVRYKQTALGIAWAIIQPVATMVVFSVFLGRLARVPSDGIPYPVFVFAALVPWTFFATAVSQASTSLVRDVNLLTKVYFPRLVMPMASVLVGVVDFGLAFTVLLGMMVAYGTFPTMNVLWLPPLLLLALGTALGTGLWLAALNVRFRDVHHVVPFLIQIWLFATPVAYPSSLVPASWRPLYGLNPMVGVVEGFRWALLGTHTRPGAMILVSALTVAVLVVSGAFFFRRLERTFADII